MAHASFMPPTQAEAFRLDAAMNATAGGVAGFLSRMTHFRDNWAALHATSRPALNHDGDHAVLRDRAFTPVEGDSLRAQIDADGMSDALETALIAFVEDELAV